MTPITPQSVIQSLVDTATSGYNIVIPIVLIIMGFTISLVVVRSLMRKWKNEDRRSSLAERKIALAEKRQAYYESRAQARAEYWDRRYQNVRNAYVASQLDTSDWDEWSPDDEDEGGDE